MQMTITDDVGREFKVPALESPVVGKWIAEHRAMKGLSLQEVANVCGVKRQAVYSWEQHKTLPTLDNLVKLVQFFNMDPIALREEKKLDEIEATLLPFANSGGRG